MSRSNSFHCLLLLKTLGIEVASLFFFVLEQEGGNSGEKPIKNCTVMTKNRVIKVVSCNNLYPFICTRNAGKIRCYVARYYDGLLFAALIATQ